MAEEDETLRLAVGRAAAIEISLNASLTIKEEQRVT